MNNPNTESLLKWNSLSREITENAIVSSMFESAFKANKPIEIFSTWLLVGTATIAAFFITNADKLLPLIKQTGFLTCGALLCISCFLGLLSRLYALICKIQIDSGSAIKNTFAEHLAKYEVEEKQIQNSAKIWGIALETGIRFDRIIKEYLVPLPFWVKWLVKRQLNKQANNPQSGYLIAIKSLQKQGFFAFLQALVFLSFLVVGFALTASN